MRKPRHAKKEEPDENVFDSEVDAATNESLSIKLEVTLDTPTTPSIDSVEPTTAANANSALANQILEDDVTTPSELRNAKKRKTTTIQLTLTNPM